MSEIEILHIIARMNIGGTARYVGELVEKIPRSALATGFVQGDEVEDSQVNRLKVYRLAHLGRRLSILNDLRAWAELWALVNKLNPAIIHTHTFKAGLIGRLVGRKIKHVHTFHGHLFTDQSFSTFQKIFISFTEFLLGRRTDVLISIGDQVGSDLRARHIGRKKYWLSIPPGVDKLPKISRADARTSLGMDQEKFIVGWMGRMTSVKNPFRLLEVAKLMPSISFAMAGGGELLTEIVKEAPNNVAVIGWTDAATFWSAVDCAISTSDNEGMPIALIEAQLAGVPVIATKVGSSAEVIESGVTGLMVKNDLIALVVALEKLTSNGEMLMSMSLKAEEIASDRFAKAKMIERHVFLYSSFK